MTGNNPTADRNKLGTKRHISTDKHDFTFSAVITSANKNDIKMVTDVIDNSVIKRPISLTKTTVERKRKLKQPLCLDKTYNPRQVEQEIIKRCAMYCTFLYDKKEERRKKQ